MQGGRRGHQRAGWKESVLKLRLSPDVTLPTDAVTQTFAVLGKRGSGKTNTASVLAEQLIEAGLPVVYVDPIGVTWGLRHSRDGKSPGLPVIILGGEHADVPLEETGGAVIADFVIEHRQPVVLDLGLFSKGAQRRFMVDFAERLYLKNRDALHVMLDECDTFVPQRIDHGGERLVGAINDLVRKGRARGLGVTLISQRPALVNKDVLTQVETLIAHRMTGPQDRDAIERWIEHNADRDGADVLASLQTLEDGDAWVWSPSWLKKMVRTHINLRETFDSSATPKAGARTVTPKHAAEVDLGELRDKLAATIEKSKADDPRELKRRIAELEKRGPAKSVEVPALSKEQTKVLADLRGILGGLKGCLPKLDEKLADLVLLHQSFNDDTMEMSARVEKLIANGVFTGPTTAPTLRYGANGVRKTVVAVERRPESYDGELPKGERAVLTAVAQNPDGAARNQISALTGYKQQTRDAYISRLVAKRFVEAPHGELVRVTADGMGALGSSFEPLPTGAALIDHWKGKLPKGERQIFETLVDAWPEGVTREWLTEVTGFVQQTRDAYISRLVRRKIIDKAERGRPIRASRAVMDSVGS
jgi:hypothetical protein